MGPPHPQVPGAGKRPLRRKHGGGATSRVGRETAPDGRRRLRWPDGLRPTGLLGARHDLLQSRRGGREPPSAPFQRGDSARRAACPPLSRDRARGVDHRPGAGRRARRRAGVRASRPIADGRTPSGGSEGRGEGARRQCPAGRMAGRRPGSWIGSPFPGRTCSGNLDECVAGGWFNLFHDHG